MLEFSSRIEITGNDSVRIQLLFGRRICSDIQVSDSDLGWFRYLMNNKMERNDRDGFAYNASRCLNLVDSLVEHEVHCLCKRHEAFMDKVELGVMALFFAFLFFAEYNFWLYVGASTLTSLALQIANQLATRRYEAMELFRNRQLATFRTRCHDFVEKEWGTLCHCTGRKGELATQGYVSRKSKPIPVDTAILPVKQ